MWKIHPKESNLNYKTIHETIAVDSNYLNGNTFTLTRPLRNIESLHLNSLVIPNFHLDILDTHFDSSTATFFLNTDPTVITSTHGTNTVALTGTNGVNAVQLDGTHGEKTVTTTHPVGTATQMNGGKTLLDLKYLLVSVDCISDNQIGNDNSSISNSSGIFIMDNLYSTTTTNTITEKSNVKIDTTATSPDNIILILKNISSKKFFYPSIGILNHINIKIMLPDGRELKRHHKTLTLFTSSNKDQRHVVDTINGGDQLVNNIAFKLTGFHYPNENNDDIYVLKTANEKRIITEIQNNQTPPRYKLAIGDIFNNPISNGDTLIIEPLKLIYDNVTKKIMLRTNEYFSALEYRIGDTIHISGSGLSFLDRDIGHRIINLTHTSTNTANLYNIIHINTEYTFSNGDLVRTHDSFFKESNVDIINIDSDKVITITNMNNNYLLTIDSDIKIPNI